jgi:SHS2 domain-containing protein
VKKYEIFEHTADIRLKVEGTTYEELFESALDGMNALLVPDNFAKSIQIKECVSLEAQDITVLLVDFLSKVLTLSYTDKSIFNITKFITLTQQSLEVIIAGANVKKFNKDIKAVTYHEAHVCKNKNNNYETIIVFDT